MKIFQPAAALLTAVSVLIPHGWAQLSGTVGPTTSTASKAAKKICNVLNYGAKADQSTDLGPALLAAFNACLTGGIGQQYKSNL
jgi:rhamnogalacturonan hydrolase